MAVAVSGMIVLNSLVLITSGYPHASGLDNMIIHYFLCRTVWSTIWNGRWFWNDRMSLCIEHHTLWKMGYVNMNEKRENEKCTGSCTAELKNLLEDWFLVFCITVLIITHDSFFFSKCLTCDLNICTHSYSGFYIYMHIHIALSGNWGFLIFGITFAFIVVLVWVKSQWSDFWRLNWLPLYQLLGYYWRIAYFTVVLLLECRL